MALYDEFERRPNRLLNAQSAYLRSAAYQPVGWFEYGPEAFAEARRMDKPILLDIGAVWCHWCHVIDRESYENPEIATLINERYIPIKVDRDERPDIDARYQTAVHLLAGQGGWPLTVFLTPEGEPFYGGTYFPPDDHGGQVGLRSLLPRLADVYMARQHELEVTSRRIAARTREAHVRVVDAGTISEGTYQRLLHVIQRRFDPEHGGFERGGPKFPHPAATEVALLQFDLTDDPAWRLVVERTLTEMGQGGVYDHLGGGFHRYAVDETWLIPHFEKLSADNAQLLENYLHAYRATGSDFYREIAEGTLAFLLREMADGTHGGFYAAQDADYALEDDGGYWTWSDTQFNEAVAADDRAILKRYFGVTPQGNMPDGRRNVLHIAEDPEAIARNLQLTTDAVTERIRHGKQALLEARTTRKTPVIDTNKYLNVNGLCIAACLEAGALLQRDDATRFALRSVDLLLERAYDDDHGCYHAFADASGARLPGMLEDQVYMARALLMAFSASGKRHYLETARHLLELCWDRYWDRERGGFVDVEFATLEQAPTGFLRQPRKPIEDLPTPAANAVAALVLDRLGLFTGEDRYHQQARRALETFAGDAPEYGPFAATYGLAVHAHLHAPAMAVIIGDLAGRETRLLWSAALQTYRPGRLVAPYAPAEAPSGYTAPSSGRAVAYVCAGQRCAPPVEDPDTLQSTLRTFGRPALGGAEAA